MLGLNLGLGVSQRALSAGYTPPAIPLRVVEAQGVMPNNLSQNATRNSHCFNSFHFIAQECTEITVGLANWYINGVTMTDGGAFTIPGLSITINGVTAPVNYSGVRTRSVSSGETEVLSDPILASAFGLSVIPYGATVQTKGIFEYAAVNQILPLTNVAGAPTGTAGYWYDRAATTPSSVDVAGDFTFTGTAPVGVSAFRCIILGKPTSDTRASYVVVGDSIADGSTDVPYNGIGPTGFIGRGLFNRGVNAFPMLRCARSGIPIETLGNGGKWTSWIKYGKYAIDEMGTNNISADTVATMQTKFNALWSLLSLNGITRIYRTHLLCITYSGSGNWNSDADQTVDSNWGPTGRVNDLHTWFASLVGSTLYGILTTNSVKSLTTPTKWRGDANHRYATDQTHPNNAGHVALGAEIRVQLDDLPFTFNSLPAAAFYYNAAQVTTLEDGAGVNPGGGGFASVIAKWKSYLGFALDTVASGTSRPAYTARTLNGIVIPDFDGTNDVMVVPGSTPLVMNPIDKGITIVMVYVPDATTSFNIFCGNGTVPNKDQMNVRNQGWSTGDASLTKSVPTSGSPIIQVNRRRNTGMQLKINNDAELIGATVINGNPVTYNIGLYPGGSTYYNGAVALLAVVNEYLPPAQLNKFIQEEILAKDFGAALTWSDLEY